MIKCWLDKINQNVNITFTVGLIANQRTKKTYAADSKVLF